MYSTYSKRKFVVAALFFFFAPLSRADQRFSASGILLRTDLSAHSITVYCREIPGYMAAMVLDLTVQKVEELDGFLPGTMIDFTLVVSQDKPFAESISAHKFQSTGPEPMAVRQLSIVGSLVDRVLRRRIH